MNIEKLISVVMPNYNGEQYLSETINSVRNQTYENWELIIVDDCSHDNSVPICQDFQRSDDRIKLIILEKNAGGPARPRNIGIQNSTGEYIALLDSDDVWAPDKLQKVADRLNLEPELDIIYHREMCFDGSNPDTKNECYTRAFEKNENMFESLLFKGNIFSPSAITIKKKIFTDNKFNEDKAYHGVEDFDLWLRLAKQNLAYSFIDEQLGKYRIHLNGISKNFKVHGQKERFLLKKHFLDPSLNKNLRNTLCIYHKLLLSILSNIKQTIKSDQPLDFIFYIKEIFFVFFSGRSK